MDNNIVVHELEKMLQDLLAISQRRKPGQVTHKIEEIKEFITQKLTEAKTDK